MIVARTKPFLRRPTLAVTDDDPEQCELLAAWFGRKGYTVRCFNSGDELLHWADTSEEKADLLIFDVDMPGRDGFQSFTAVRQLPQYQNAEAIFVTSRPEPAVVARSRDVGAVCLVPKDAAMLENLGWVVTTLAADG